MSPTTTPRRRTPARGQAPPALPFRIDDPAATTRFQSWLRAFDADPADLIQVALFLSSPVGRRAASQVIDDLVREMAERDGVSYADIATRFGWSEGNVQKRITRSRRLHGTVRPVPPRRSDRPQTED